MPKETGGAAFPLSGDWAQIKDKGMTLRDYFAAKAMQYVLDKQEIFGIDYEWTASLSYGIADAMLEARK